MSAKVTYSTCAHGVGLSRMDDCPACGLIWHEDQLARAEVQVRRHTRVIAELRAKLPPAGAALNTSEGKETPSKAEESAKWNRT